MRKTFEMDYGNGTELEEFDVDYMVLFGAYDNEHPEIIIITGKAKDRYIILWKKRGNTQKVIAMLKSGK